MLSEVLGECLRYLLIKPHNSLASYFLLEIIDLTSPSRLIFRISSHLQPHATSSAFLPIFCLSSCQSLSPLLRSSSLVKRILLSSSSAWNEPSMTSTSIHTASRTELPSIPIFRSCKHNGAYLDVYQPNWLDQRAERHWQNQ